MKEGSASLKRTLSQGTGEPWGGVRQRRVDPGSCASDFPVVPCRERFAGGPEGKQERQLRDDCRVWVRNAGGLDQAGGGRQRDIDALPGLPPAAQSSEQAPGLRGASLTTQAASLEVAAKEGCEEPRAGGRPSRGPRPSPGKAKAKIRQSGAPQQGFWAFLLDPRKEAT